MSAAASRFVQEQIDAELARFGSILLAEYGEEVFQVRTESGATELRPHPLGSLGGLLLQHYGKKEMK